MSMGKLWDRILDRRKRRHPYCAALVPAAGRSERMGGTDKLTAPLCGVPVLLRTLTALDGTVIEPQDIPLSLHWSRLPPETLLLAAGAWLLAEGRVPEIS